MERTNASAIRTRIRRALGSRAGYSAPMILVAIAIVVLTAAAAAAFAVKVRSELRRQTAFSSREAFVQKIRGHVLNEQGWLATLVHPSNAAAFACLNAPGASCCGNADVPFAVVDQSLNVVYDSRTGPNVGFTYGDSPCANYDDAVGHADCPMRGEVTWTAVDPGSDPLCRSAQIKIEVKHKNPQNAIPYNSKDFAKYDGVFVRTQEEGFLISHCSALGGTFSQKTNECRLDIAGQSCPAGQFLTGIDAAGNKICSPVSSLVNGVGLCPTGSAIRSLALAGDTASPDCAYYPSMPPCSAGFHVEGSYCYTDDHGPCSVSGGTGRLLWNGSGYPCTATACNPGWQAWGGGCYQIQNIAPYTFGIFVPGGQVPLYCADPSFVISGAACSCPGGQHVEGGACVNDSRGCGYDCGSGVFVSGVQYWAGAWGACSPTAACPGPPPPSCPPGEHFNAGGTCEPDVRACSYLCPYDGVTYSGNETWNGGGWNACDATALCTYGGYYGGGPE